MVNENTPGTMGSALAHVVLPAKLRSRRQGNATLKVPALNSHAEIIGNLQVSRHLRAWRHN